MHSLATRKKCRLLREKGFSLNELVYQTNIAKSTVQGWVGDIVLDRKAKERIRTRVLQGILKSNRNKRIELKGLPRDWPADFITLIAHFMFDGGAKQDGFVYYSKDKAQVARVEKLIKKYFGLKPKIRIAKNGVIRLICYSRNLREYLPTKFDELLEHIQSDSCEQKRAFLKAFYDDEGNIYYSRKDNIKRIRGYQNSPKILKIVRGLLKDFKIDGSVDAYRGGITIWGKENLEKFQQEINFSPGIYLNPKRKNSLWRKRLEKRQLLRMAIGSYL